MFIKLSTFSTTKNLFEPDFVNVFESIIQADNPTVDKRVDYLISNNLIENSYYVNPELFQVDFYFKVIGDNKEIVKSYFLDWFTSLNNQFESNNILFFVGENFTENCELYSKLNLKL
jgi:hypothetical protein